MGDSHKNYEKYKRITAGAQQEGMIFFSYILEEGKKCLRFSHRY